MSLLRTVIIATLLSLTGTIMSQSGLDAPVAVAPYFNGVFPASTPGGLGAWQTVEAFPHLRFADPVKLVPQPRSTRLHIIGKDGLVWSFENSPAATTKSLVLDIRSRVQSTDNTGLIGIAFHPQFGNPSSPDRGYFYLFYFYSPQPRHLPAVDLDGDGVLEGDETLRHTALRLSRFTIPDDSITADHTSERVLIQQYDRQAWHNGGAICFGTDGFLYIAIGDEGNDTDLYQSMQRFDERLLGGVMRIDVDKDPTRSHPIRRQPRFRSDAFGDPLPLLGTAHTYSQDYYIPNDNPWLYPGGEELEEYWAIGIRSPHTMTSDPLTGRLWLGDVGESAWEEINLITKGKDYEWPYLEGPLAVPGLTKTHRRTAPRQSPAHAYDHSPAGGTAVIGGYVYSGREHATALQSKYLFSDHGNPTVSHVWAMDATSGATPELLCDLPSGGFHTNIAAWGQDHAGEPLMVVLGRDPLAPAGNGFLPPLDANGQPVLRAENGRILKLARSLVNVPEPPLRLSETGAFSALLTLTPAPGFIPYEVNAPFWSDGAEKQRWISVPNDGTHDQTGERIQWSATEPWAFPVGTVFMKHFDLPVDERAPTSRARIETRFMIHGTAGWYGVTYRWRDDGTDADLLTTAATRTLQIHTATATRAQTWPFPSRSDCMTCHNDIAGNVLGCNTHQLSSPIHYPTTGRSASQLGTLRHLGMFANAPTDTALQAAPQSCHPLDLSQPLELRARSYLDSNCAACHRPGGANTTWDARLPTPLAQSGLINGTLKRSYSIPGEAIVRAHSPARSILHYRTGLLGTLAMPPIAKGLADTAGVETLRAWIDSLDPSLYPAPGAPPLPNGPPTAYNDTFTLPLRGSLAIDVGRNDRDWQSTPWPASLMIITPPTHGRLTPSAGSTYLYTHEGTERTDSFTYRIPDPEGLFSNEALVTLQMLTAAEQWQREHFTSVQLADPAVSGWQADPDGDSAQNLTEYATGQNPLDAAGNASLQLQLESGKTVITLPRRRTAEDVIISVEHSLDLRQWQRLTTSEAQEDSSPTQFKVTIAAPTAGFFRLKFTLTP